MFSKLAINLSKLTFMFFKKMIKFGG